MSSQDSKRLYSWLWDSHINPRNSKWLQENLADIDSTVKQMIKIIEEDGDSFASRAEMYYKRRPELMRLVEQFYRASRGLAERYTHATGVIRQAHHTMAEAFPDRVPPLLLTDEFHTTRVANVAERCEWDEEMMGFTESGIGGNLESEKEGGLVRLHMISERLSALESRVTLAEEESIRLKEQASRAGAEVHLSNEALRRSEAEKEAVVVQYKQCVERISSLESELSCDAETRVQTLKNALVSAEAEKDTILAQYCQCATMISSLQKKLFNAEDEARRTSEVARKAEDEVVWLKKEIAKLEEEKEVASLVYWQSIEKISSLENEFSSTQNEVLRLNGEISSTKFKLQGADELRFDSSQLFSKEELLKECELRNESLKDEIVKMKEAMENLKEQNLSSELSMEHLKSENEELRAKKILKLDKEVEVRLNQRNALQLEIKSLHYKHDLILGQMVSAGLDSECFRQIVRELHDENAELNNICLREKDEKKVLLEKLRSMEILLEENSMMRRSICELNRALGNADAEPEETCLNRIVRKVEDLKQKLRQTLDNNELLALEKSVLVMLFGQLRIETAEAEKERNALVENLNSESQKLTALQNEAENLVKINNVLGQKVNEKSDHVEKLENDVEALNLKLSELQNSYRKDFLELKLVEELTMVKNENDYKESQLHRAEQKLVDTRKEKALLEDNFEVVKNDFSKVRETLDAHILRLSSDNTFEVANNRFLQKMAKQWDAELVAVREQCEETKAREISLSSELEIARNEIKVLFSKLLILSVEETVFIEKANELAEKCRSLDKQRISESGDVQVLREKVIGLEGENVGLKARLDALVAAVDSLSDSFLSLERHTGKIHENAEESKDVGLDSYLRGQGTEDHDVAASFEGLRKVQDLRNRIRALEKSFQDMVTLRIPENMSTERTKKVQADSDTPKDITLDQASKLERSSRKEERMLELWEIGSEGQSIELTVSKGQNPKANHISEIMAVDEEFEIVDKLEVSKRFIDSYHQENKRKMLEKLESDGLKLTNLQITVQDLMNKVSITEKINKKYHDIEYNTVKEQLEEAEEAIAQLYQMNTKLKKAVRDNDHIASHGKSQSEFEHAWALRRRKILDQANRGAERIGRLQLEVQKLQFLLLKLDNEQEKKLKTQVTDSGPKFLLKDYLHDRARSVRLTGTNQSKKKIFCGCIHPPTNGDSPRYK